MLRSLCLGLGLLCGMDLAAAFAQDQTQTSRPIDVTLADTLRFPLDFRGLNHRPAGALGRVRAEGEALVFGDGSPARFWGVNIQAHAIFRSTEPQITAHVDRLARMGVNIVRLHHHDSAWVNPNIFGARDSQSAALSPVSMGKIDLWISKLRAQGIYIWLDLHVGRALTARDGPGQDFDEIINGEFKGDLRGYNFVNDDVKTLMKDFTARYLGHVNRYTGLAYKDDPAIAVVMISNENDLTRHYASKLLAERGAPGHEKRYRALADAYAQDWGLDPKQVWKFWEWGPAKLFIADLEHRFFADMVSHLRELGYPGVISTSQFWGGTPMAVLPPQTAGDIIDVHSYGREGDIFLTPQSERAGLLPNIAAAHISGMPLSVTEWNISDFRAPDRLFMPVQVAAMAAFQDWDAMMLYGYAQRGLNPKDRQLDKWHAANDPNLMVSFPAASLLYRRGHVAPARYKYVLQPKPEDLFGSELSAKTLRVLRHLPEQARISTALPATPQLPWLDASKIAPGSVIVEDAQALPQTGDIPPFQRDAETGLFTLDDAQSQIILGHLNNRGVALSGLEAQVSHEAGLLAVQSTTDADLAQSDQVLISVALPSQPREGGKRPFIAPPLNGTLRFDAAPGLVLRSVVPATRKEKITHSEENGRHIVEFNNAPGALWLVLERP